MTDNEHFELHDEQRTEPEASENGSHHAAFGPHPVVFTPWRIAALCGAICLMFATLVWLWSATPDSPPVGNATGAEQQEAGAEKLAYEESFGGPLEESIKRVDYALVQSMDQTGVAPDALEIRSVEVRTLLGQNYHVQTLSLNLNSSVRPFVDDFGVNLDRWAANATLESREDGSWTVSVFGRTTHRLYLHELPPSPVPDSDAPALTIVIDDMGESMSFARKLAELDYPVTFSIWPRSTHAREVEDMAVQQGLEVLVHQPMEPMGYPKVRPGPGAVFVDMDEKTVRATVEENLSRLPAAVGMNNHMGSRFTQQKQGMDTVLKVLRSHRLFALDSLTHPGSVVGEEARRLGVPCLRRDVFLDVVHDANAVLNQLHKAERIAVATGRAIAIGHPMPQTLAALQQWKPGVAVGKRLRIITLVKMGGFENLAARHAGHGKTASAKQ